MKLPPVWIYRFTVAIRNKLKDIYYAMVPANIAVFERSQQFWIAKALGVACELNLAEIIGEGNKSVEDIAGEASVDADSLYRLLRALASEGIFRETQFRYFENTKTSSSLKGGEGSMKYMIQHQLNPDNWAVVNELKYSVTTGKSAVRKLYGKGVFEHIAEDPERNELYNKAMINTSDVTTQSMIKAYDFSKIRRMVDVGGGQGRLLASVLSKYPKMEAVLLDLPHVVENAEKEFEKFGVSERIEIIAGSFFETMPEQGDAYIMKNILHNFDDENCITILKKVRGAIKQDGRLLILELMIDDGNKASYGKIFDLQMLLGTDGAKERTRAEYAKLFSNAGFELVKVVDMVSPFSIFEGRPV